MAEQGKNLQNILNDFYRYKRAENSRRFGAFGLNFDTDEGRRFADQIHMLKGLNEFFIGETSRDIKPVSLQKEIHFPEELSEEQLLYYFSRRPSYAVNDVRKNEEYYARLYLLELANEIHHPGPDEALKEVFTFWDSMQEVSDPEKDTDSGQEYLRRLCLSFLIAHSDMADAVRKGLIDRDLYWKYDLIGEIRQGRFARAGLFVKKYARLLKPEEISGDKPYVEAAWQAMPKVFFCLDQTFGDNTGHLFRRFLSAGEETSTEIEILPVRRRALGQKRRIPLADTCYLDSRPSYGSVHKERWVRTEWTLKEGAQDFLYLIHLYTESYAREHFMAPKRKRTADRFLKKKYLRTGDDPAVIRGMKEVMRDERFAQAISEGVSLYMAEHPAPVKERGGSRKRHAQLLYQMDHENPGQVSRIDYDRFRKAKTDADSVLNMLHQEEIDYAGKSDLENDINDSVKTGAEPVRDVPAGGETLFSPEEKRLLLYLTKGDQREGEEYINSLGLSVSLMIKQINQKALDLWEDVLLERRGSNIHLVEDYIDELRSML